MATAEAIAAETVVDEPAPVEETAPLEDVETETGADEQAETIEETFTKADLEEAIKQREREWQESREAEQHEAQRSQTEIAIRQRAPAQLTNILQWTAKEVAKVVARAERNGETIDPNEVALQFNPVILKTLTDELFSAVNFKENEAITQHFEKYVSKTYGDWKPSSEVRRRFEAASKSDNPDTRATARWEYMRAAMLDSELPKALETARKEAGKKTQTAAEVEKARTANSAPGPTKGVGSAAANSAAQIDAVLNDLNRPVSERRVAFEKKYGFKPNF